MKKQIKKQKLISIRVYFDEDVIPKKIEVLAKKMGLSVSSATGMMIRYGFPQFEAAFTRVMKEDAQHAKTK